MLVIEKRTENELPITKIILVLVAAFVIAGMGISWFCIMQNEKKADELMAKAQDAFRNNHLSQGLETIDQALKLKEKPDYLKVKLDILYNQDKASEAKLVLDKLVTLEPKNAHYHYLLGNLAFNNDANHEEAIRQMTQAVKLAPSNVEYQVNQAILLSRDDRFKESAPIFEHLLKTDPHYYHIWDQYALSYSTAGLFKEALAIRQRALAQFPNDYLHHFGLATLYDEMGQKKAAASEYLRSLQLHPLEDSIAAKRIYEITGKRVPPALENLTSDTVPFSSQGKVMFVSANVNGESGKFMIDTGATYSIIYQHKVNKYKVHFIPLVMPFETANGTIQAPIAYGSLRLGKHDLQDVRFAVIPDAKDDSIDGIIGMNVLEAFHFEINQAAREITLKR